MGRVDGPLERIRRPEYTGANRCLPCTALNVVLAAAGSGLLAAAAATVWGSAAAVGVGATATAVSLAAIYLRGYLVPGTPTITARYFPEAVLRQFGKSGVLTADSLSEEAGAPADAVRHALEEGSATGFGATDSSEVDGDAVAATLAEADAVGDDGLSEEFAAAWREEMASLGDDDEALADRVVALVGAPRPITIRPEDIASDLLVARAGDSKRKVAQWESRPAAVADLAAGALLDAQTEGWGTLSVSERGAALYVLRSVLDFCPACDAAVSDDWETVDRVAVPSCCSGTVSALACDDCGTRLVETEARAD